MKTMNLTVEYCTRCSLLDPAVEVTKALLSRFGTEIKVMLDPNQEGRFTLRADDRVLYSNQAADHLLEPDDAIRMVESHLAVSSEPQWEPEALAALETIPPFVRERVRKQIGQHAQEQGISCVTAKVFAELRAEMMQRMGGGIPLLSCR